jgi:hypothetical protein
MGQNHDQQQQFFGSGFGADFGNFQEGFYEGGNTPNQFQGGLTLVLIRGTVGYTINRIMLVDKGHQGYLIPEVACQPF